MLTYPTILQPLSIGKNYGMDVLRLDLLHPEIGGNKWFKLKLNLAKAKSQGHSVILTFGGPYSNHLAATAAACRLEGLKPIGIIRGEAPDEYNPTLLKAKEDGMQLHFVDRTTYDRKSTKEFRQEMEQRYGPHYLIPEGGHNEEGVRGCMDILKPEYDHDYIFCACGTGTTFAGILSSATAEQIVIGINVLKGENQLARETEDLLRATFPGWNKNIGGNDILSETYIDRSGLIDTYCFNGYARFNSQLTGFKNTFEKEFNIPLDHVYTAKLFYAVWDLVEKQKPRPGSKILIIHSGGLQGNAGFEQRYPKAVGIFS